MPIPRVQGAEATALGKTDREHRQLRELEFSRLRRLVGGWGKTFQEKVMNRQRSE